MMNFLAGKKAVIFDLDGLLIDSEPVWTGTDKAFREKHALPFPSPLSKKSHGMGVRDYMLLMKKEGLKGDVDALADEYRSLFYDVFLSSDSFTLMEGAGELLQTLKERGMPIAIATGGHTKEKVAELLRKFRLEKAFTLIVSSDEVPVGKPAPDVYLYTAKKLKTDPARCVVFEDSANGVTAGKAAGMTAIGINAVYEYQKQLEDAGADIIAPSLEAIVPLFGNGCCQGYENCACA